MTVKELIERLTQLPQDYRVEALYVDRYCDDNLDVSSDDVVKIEVYDDRKIIFLSTRLP